MKPEALWIWCDIDGHGRKWRLAVTRIDKYYFPFEDFEECMEAFDDCSKTGCLPPKFNPDGEYDLN